MMTVSEARGLYLSASGRFSENVRWLAAGGFATVYAIAREDFERLAAAPPLLIPLALFVLAAVADALQYLVTAHGLRTWVGSLDPTLSSDAEVPYSARHNIWPEVMFIVKGVLLLAGWVALAIGWTYLVKSAACVCV